MSPSQRYILLYDSECLLCSDFLQVINKPPLSNQMVIFSLQGAFGRAFLASHQLAVDTVILIDTYQEKHYVKSKAMFELLPLRFPFFRGLFRAVEWLFPTSWADGIYDLIARNRHRWTKSVCRVGERMSNVVED